MSPTYSNYELHGGPADPSVYPSYPALLYPVHLPRYVGGYLEYVGGYLEYVGGYLEYVGGYLEYVGTYCTVCT